MNGVIIIISPKMTVNNKLTMNLRINYNKQSPYQVAVLAVPRVCKMALVTNGEFAYVLAALLRAEIKQFKWRSSGWLYNSLLQVSIAITYYSESNNFCLAWIPQPTFQPHRIDDW